MQTDRTLIEKLAALARLELSDQEITTLTEQLPKILEYVGQLQNVQTLRIDPAHDDVAPLRADSVVPSPTARAILDQAPEHADRFWKVDGVFTS